MAENPPEWYREIFPGGPRNGFYESMTHHALVFVGRDPDTLVVSFDNLAEAGGRHLSREPWAGKFVSDHGWSHLGIFANGPTWFRDATLIARLEALRDNGLFAKYRRVFMCGTSMGGFGALAFAPLAPGARVIAFSPQSTLDASLVPWEYRFAKGRAQDWSLPYSDAAEGVRQAGQVYVVLDPFTQHDRQHAMRLAGDNVMLLNAPGCGHKTAFVINRMQNLKAVMKAAIDGTLTPTDFARLMRARKEVYLYKESMQNHLRSRNRDALADRFGAAFKKRRKERIRQA